MDTKKILIIEDDPHLSDLMKGHLGAMGFEIETAADGEQGIQALEHAPDLILLDVMLPKTDGLTILRMIREKGTWGAKVPIIIVSNLNPDTDEILRSTAMYAPAYYLVKAELSLEEMAGKVRTALSLA
jgi:DNA-binding response OmpR family regulator